MKIHRLLPFFIVILLSLITAGCPKHPINGALDGQWQVMQVEPEAPETILTERLYMCFNLHVCQLTQYGTGAETVGNLKYDEGKSLTLYFPYAHNDRGRAILKQYGIYTNPVTFTIEHLDKKSLVLRDGDVVVTLRKF